MNKREAARWERFGERVLCVFLGYCTAWFLAHTGIVHF